LYSINYETIPSREDGILNSPTLINPGNQYIYTRSTIAKTIIIHQTAINTGSIIWYINELPNGIQVSSKNDKILILNITYNSVNSGFDFIISAKNKFGVSRVSFKYYAGFLTSSYPIYNIPTLINPEYIGINTTSNATFIIKQTAIDVGIISWSLPILPIGISVSSSNNSNIILSVLSNVIYDGELMSVSASSSEYGGTTEVSFLIYADNGTANITLAQPNLQNPNNVRVFTGSGSLQRTFLIQQLTLQPGIITWSSNSIPIGISSYVSNSYSNIFAVTEGTNVEKMVSISASNVRGISTINFNLMTTSDFTIPIHVPQLVNPESISLYTGSNLSYFTIKQNALYPRIVTWTSNLIPNGITTLYSSLNEITFSIAQYTQIYNQPITVNASNSIGSSSITFNILASFSYGNISSLI
jgi:hypothetical protein